MAKTTSSDSEVVHLVVLVDQSGSMLGDGRMQAVNTALGESLPHLQALARTQALRLDVVGFADETTHVMAANLPDDSRMPTIEVVRQGLTELGAALRYSVSLARDVPARRRVLVLVTDGRPTDTVSPGFDEALDDLDRKADFERVAVAIGRRAETDALARFVRGDEAAICRDAMQVIGRLRQIVLAP